MAFLKGDVYSYELGQMTPLEIYLPWDDNKRFLVNKAPKTLILLHGLGGNNSYWSRYSSVERYAQEHNIALVMPEAGIGMYCDMLYGQNYDRYIALELRNIIGNLFNIPTNRDHYYIAGLSMGGYGALKIALKHPDVFSKCGSFSGALMIGTKDHLSYLSSLENVERGLLYNEMEEIEISMAQGCKAAFGPDFSYRSTEDLFWLVDKQMGCNDELPEILLTCGKQDFLYQANKDFACYLSRRGVTHDYFEWEGIHNWKFWDESIRDHIGFFAD